MEPCSSSDEFQEFINPIRLRKKKRLFIKMTQSPDETNAALNASIQETGEDYTVLLGRYMELQNYTRTQELKNKKLKDRLEGLERVRPDSCGPSSASIPLSLSNSIPIQRVTPTKRSLSVLPQASETPRDSNYLHQSISSWMGTEIGQSSTSRSRRRRENNNGEISSSTSENAPSSVAASILLAFENSVSQSSSSNRVRTPTNNVRPATNSANRSSNARRNLYNVATANDSDNGNILSSSDRSQNRSNNVTLSTPSEDRMLSRMRVLSLQSSSESSITRTPRAVVTPARTPQPNTPRSSTTTPRTTSRSAQQNPSLRSINREPLLTPRTRDDLINLRSTLGRSNFRGVTDLLSSQRTSRPVNRNSNARRNSDFLIEYMGHETNDNGNLPNWSKATPVRHHMENKKAEVIRRIEGRQFLIRSAARERHNLEKMKRYVTSMMLQGHDVGDGEEILNVDPSTVCAFSPVEMRKLSKKNAMLTPELVTRRKSQYHSMMKQANKVMAANFSKREQDKVLRRSKSQSTLRLL